MSPKVTLELRLDMPKQVAGGIGGGGSGDVKIMQVFLELDFSGPQWRMYKKARKSGAEEK